MCATQVTDDEWNRFTRNRATLFLDEQRRPEATREELSLLKRNGVLGSKANRVYLLDPQLAALALKHFRNGEESLAQAVANISKEEGTDLVQAQLLEGIPPNLPACTVPEDQLQFNYAYSVTFGDGKAISRELAGFKAWRTDILRTDR